MTRAPAIKKYGTWPSPVSALMVAADRVTFSDLQIGADGSVWWAETRPAEAGRTVVVRRDPGGATFDMLPAGSDVRTRVHEYGGAAWRLTREGFAFSDASDGRVYLSNLAMGVRVPLTPQRLDPHSARFADMEPLPDGSALIAVRERHGLLRVVRDLVIVPLDGSKSGAESELAVVYHGSDFVTSPRISPDGRALAFITWDHPAMPWNACELRVLELGSDVPAQVVAGGSAESVFQPEWSPEGKLLIVSDRSGWWNLYRVEPHGIEPLCPMQKEFGEPAWVLGMATYAVLNERHAVVRYGTDTHRLATLDLRSGVLIDVVLPFVDLAPSLAANGGQVALIAETPDARTVVARLELSTGALLPLRTDVLDSSCRAYIATPRAVSVTAYRGPAIPARLYEPASPDAVGLGGERPPWVVLVHGGPTWRRSATALEVSFFTSRGIGVMDLDYTGTTGWGRDWRQALYGQWGVQDAADCVAAASWLVGQGLADRGRVAIRGGSAGGWTALCAVAGTDVFGAAVSLCGVVDATRLAAETHDFESHYLDALIGPLPEASNQYLERSPLSRVQEVRVPVLLLQTLDDPVVPASQAEALVSALEANGTVHAYVGFAGEQHGLRQAKNRVAALEAELSFYGQIFGFDPPDVPKLPIRYRDTGWGPIQV